MRDPSIVPSRRLLWMLRRMLCRTRRRKTPRRLSQSPLMQPTEIGCEFNLASLIQENGTQPSLNDGQKYLSCRSDH